MEATTTTLPALRNDAAIIQLEAARTALAEATTVQQTKKIVDVASAAEIFARRQKLGEEVEQQAHGIKIDALRKLGEILQATPRAGARFHEGNGKLPSSNGHETLAELGLDKRTSSVAQKLATLPIEQFEQVREGHKTIGAALAAIEGNKSSPSSNPSKTTPPAEVAALQAKVTELQEQVERQAEALAELADVDKTLEALKGGEKETAKEMQVLRLELRSCKRRRDELMRESAEQKKEIARWKKKAEKK